MKRATIIVTVHRGMVEVVHNPTKARVVVRDYDVEGFDSDGMQVDPDGERYIERTY